MALIVEDGTGKSNSNSYGTIAGARSYASDRGITLSADDTVVSSQLILGTDYLETFSDEYVGQPTTTTQALSWPRKNVMLDPDTPFPDDEIPQDLINALYQSVIEQFNGIVLQPSAPAGAFVIEERVDVLMTKYSEKIGTTSQPLLSKINDMLSGLLNNGGAGGQLRTLRI